MTKNIIAPLLVFVLTYTPKVSAEEMLIGIVFEVVGNAVLEIELPKGYSQDTYALLVYSVEEEAFIDSGVDLMQGQKFVFPTQRTKFGIGGFAPEDQEKLMKDSFPLIMEFLNPHENGTEIRVTPFTSEL